LKFSGLDGRLRAVIIKTSCHPAKDRAILTDSPIKTERTRQKRGKAAPISLALERDEKGIVLRPVTEWLTATAAEIVVILGIQYIEIEAGTEGPEKSIQFGLTPQQALELAETLKKHASKLLETPPPGTAKYPN